MGSEDIVLLGAALLAGAINSVAGGGTFLTFPALLVTGMPGIAANATSTVALWPGSLAAAWGYRREMAAHRARLKEFAGISFVGGLGGAMLLLVTPEAMFASLIPWLMLVATLIFAFGGKLRQAIHALSSRRRGGIGLTARKATSFGFQFLVALYGGYFGAGIGILMLAMFELLGIHNIHESNALKCLLAVLINGVAMVTFIVAGAVVWPQALLMTGAAIAGGFGGAALARRLPPRYVRWFVLLVAVAMTGWFFVEG